MSSDDNQSTSTLRRSSRIRRRQSQSSGSDPESDHDASSPNISNNRNHNRNNSNIANMDDSDSDVLIDEEKNIEEEDSDSDDGNDGEGQAIPPVNYSMNLPSEVSKLGTKYRRWDDDIRDFALPKIIDTAQSIAEYHQNDPNRQEHAERLQAVMNRLVDLSRTMQTEKLLFERLTDDIRNGALDRDRDGPSQSQSGGDPSSQNPVLSGDWERYVGSARTLLTEEILNGEAKCSKSADIKGKYTQLKTDYGQQFEEAIRCEDIEEFEEDEDGNRNHNGNGGNEVDSGEEESEDEDLVIENNRNKDINVGSIKCPLTKAIFKQPVKSKVCNHTFEKAAIEQYLQSKLSANELAECPLPGCNNILNADQMIRDVKIEKMIKAANRQAQGGGDSDEDDGCFDLTMRTNHNSNNE